jgi:hypothetical protein
MAGSRWNRDEADRRMRKVYASDRLRLLFGQYQRFLFELLSPAHDALPRSGRTSLENGAGD